MTPEQTAAVESLARPGSEWMVTDDQSRQVVYVTEYDQEGFPFVGAMPLLIGPDGRVWREFEWGTGWAGKWMVARDLLEQLYRGDISEQQLHEAVEDAAPFPGFGAGSTQGGE